MALDDSNLDFGWAPGFHAPQVDARDFALAVSKMKEKTPDALYHASKKKSHVLHSAVWAESDGVWAERARKDFCAGCLRSVVIRRVVGDDDAPSEPVRYLHSIEIDGARQFRTLLEISRNPAETAQLMEAIRADIAVIDRKLRTLTSFLRSLE